MTSNTTQVILGSSQGGWAPLRRADLADARKRSSSDSFPLMGPDTGHLRDNEAYSSLDQPIGWRV
jgi:hypothetical protein